MGCWRGWGGEGSGIGVRVWVAVVRVIAHRHRWDFWYGRDEGGKQRDRARARD